MKDGSHIFSVCCLLLLGLLLSSCAGPSAGELQKNESERQWGSNMQAGRDAFDQGLYLLASRLFEQALDEGRQLGNAGHIADAAFNLTFAQIQLGEYAAASTSLREAKSSSRRGGGNLSEMLLWEARLARLQTITKRSRVIINQLLLQLPETEQRLHPQAYLLSGLLACEAGDMPLAKQELAKAAQLLGNDSPLTIAASQAELEGCIKLLQEQPLAAGVDFDRESVLLQQSHQYRQMVDALHRAGAAYAAAGQYPQAADRLFRAARRAFSQKRPQQAQLLLEKSSAVALDADDRLLQESIAHLRKEIANRNQLPTQN